MLGKCLGASSATLAAFADPAKHPPGERSVVELGEHELKRELQPVIAVTIAPCPCIELKFLFALTAHIGGVRLSIVDGHIVGGDLGELWASAQLSYEGTPLHPAAGIGEGRACRASSRSLRRESKSRAFRAGG